MDDVIRIRSLDGVSYRIRLIADEDCLVEEKGRDSSWSAPDDEISSFFRMMAFLDIRRHVIDTAEAVRKFSRGSA